MSQINCGPLGLFGLMILLANTAVAQSGDKTSQKSPLGQPPQGAEAKLATAGSADAAPAFDAMKVVTGVELKPGWATFGHVFPKGYIRDGVVIVGEKGPLVTQVDIKNRWEDGSAKFGVITVLVPYWGVFSIHSGVNDSRQFTPAPAPVVVEIVVKSQEGDSTKYQYVTEGVPDRERCETWLTGGLVREWRQELKGESQRGPHRSIRAIIGQRVYRDASQRIEVIVENVLDVDGADVVNYDVRVRSGEKVLFEQKEVVHAHGTRWRKMLGLRLAESEITPDLLLPQVLNFMPTYDPAVALFTPNRDPAKFQILQQGCSTYVDMTAPGGRPELYFLPAWTVSYLRHRSQQLRSYVIESSELAGSWSIHLREPIEGDFKGVGPGRMISIDERPKFWWDSRSRLPDTSKGNWKGRGKFSAWDSAHVPSFNYVPYLLTGDRYHVEELAFWANASLMFEWPGTKDMRGGSLKRLIHPNMQPRGMAWALRDMAHAALILPDDDPMQKYCRESVTNTLAWFDEYARTSPKPMGVAWVSVARRQRANGGDAVAVYMHIYLAWVIDVVNSMGFEGGTVMRDDIAQFILNLYEDKAFPPQHRAVGSYVIGRNDQPFSTFQEIYDASFPDPTIKVTTYYGPEHRIALLLALKAGKKEAAVHLDQIEQKLATELANSYLQFSVCYPAVRPPPSQLGRPQPTQLRPVR